MNPTMSDNQEPMLLQEGKPGTTQDLVNAVIALYRDPRFRAFPRYQFSDVVKGTLLMLESFEQDVIAARPPVAASVKSFQEFLSECCEANEECFIELDELTEAYVEWLGGGPLISELRMGEIFHSACLKQSRHRRSAEGKQIRTVEGIAWKTTKEPHAEQR